MNPKSITMKQLYGHIDSASQTWRDGFVPKVFRDFAYSSDEGRKWIIFDGPIDAGWIENMNTALDDNKKLCLMSGEIITMTPTMNMIFETCDLEQASPSTVSRCGMIYIEPDQLGWRTLKESYLKGVPAGISNEQKEMLDESLDWLIPACFSFLKKQCRFFVTSSELHKVQVNFSDFEFYFGNHYIINVFELCSRA